MLRSLRSGEVIDRRWMRFAFPARCFYDVLRGLDYLRRAGVNPDKRAAEAIEIVTMRRHQNGRGRSITPLPAARIRAIASTLISSLSIWTPASAGPAIGTLSVPSGYWIGTRTAPLAAHSARPVEIGQPSSS